MTTATQALAAIRSRLVDGGVGTTGISIPLRWQGDNQDPLPDEPTSFAFVVFNNQGSGPGPVSFGGGIGGNTYRNRCSIEAFVFSPGDRGLALALDGAETIAARLRSFRDASVSCFAASVIPIGPGSSISPPGMHSAAGNYQCAVAEIDMLFDQLG